MLFNNITFADFRQKMTESGVYQRSPDSCAMKYFVLIPNSCKVLPSFEGKHDEAGITIEKKDQVTIPYNHVAKSRQMDIAIYNISKGDKVCHVKLYVIYINKWHTLR